ncbi:MAG TPA: YihY/virulence factor BrkB family protein [Haloferula sp.]
MNYWKILKQTADEFVDDGALRLSAALSYYAAFSLAPLLLISIAVAGWFLGDEAVRGQLDDHLKSNLGSAGAAALQDMIAHARKPEANLAASTLGLGMLVFGAGGVFGQLQEALNAVWGVKRKGGRGWKGLVKDRFFSFAMVLGTGFLLLTSMLLTAFLQAISMWSGSILSLPPQLWTAISTLLSFLVITALFAAIFKVLPDARIAWRHVWLGAMFTAILFTIGKFLMGWYLGREATASAYGATGALALVLLWVYYSSMILLFGAEFTQVSANSLGAPIQPDDDAVAIEHHDVEVPPQPHTAEGHSLSLSAPQSLSTDATPGRAKRADGFLTAAAIIPPAASAFTGWTLGPPLARKTRSVIEGSAPLRAVAGAVRRFRTLHPSLFKFTLITAAVLARRMGKKSRKHQRAV